MTFKRCASLILPKSLGYIRQVVRKARDGWGTRRYGTQEYSISQVDPITLYTLIIIVEALLASALLICLSYTNISMFQTLATA